MKNILLSVCGLSPQVITETLYALNQMNRRVHEIHVITTRPGKDRILSQLLDGGKGPYYLFLEEYGVPDGGIDFGLGNIHVVRDSLGAEIEDIVGESDNTQLLNTCMELAFHHTRDMDTAVFFSIAGGRKTMSGCLTLAAQMYGRRQDRLYHVLITPEFESNRNFFYPPRQADTIELRNPKGEPYFKSTQYARVNLIHMPFFSIRSQLAPEIMDQPRDPATLMLSLIRESQEKLVVDVKANKISYLGMEMDMMPNRLALFAFFALLKKECPDPEQQCRNCDKCFLDYDSISLRQADITRLYKQLCGTRPTEEMSKTGILGLDSANLRSSRSRINNDLVQAFGPLAGGKIAIASTGKRPNTRYGLTIDRSVIEVVM